MTGGGGPDADMMAVAELAGGYADQVDRNACFPEETFAAIRRHRLLSLLIPSSLGGHGASLSRVGESCHALARSCGSSGMIFAMHQIQVACVVAHGETSDWHRTLLRGVCEEQMLLGSVTSESGV